MFDTKEEAFREAEDRISQIGAGEVEIVELQRNRAVDEDATKELKRNLRSL